MDYNQQFMCHEHLRQQQQQLPPEPMQHRSRSRQSRARKKSSKAKLYHQASFEKQPSFEHDEIHV
jgi:hypothetical protein